MTLEPAGFRLAAGSDNRRANARTTTGSQDSTSSPSRDPLVQPFDTDWEQFRPLLKKGWDPIVIADRLALGLARARHLLILPLARAARQFVQGQDWTSFGYARLEDHARERFGRSGRWVRDLRSLADAADRCPGISRAISGEDGGPPIGGVAALVIGRVADADTCEAWIALARQITVRRLRVEVQRARQAGSASPLPEQASELVGTPGARLQEMATWGAHGRGYEEYEEGTDLLTLRFAAPSAVGAAVDEARELHRAISGGETSVAEFVEVLIAEAYAGAYIPLVNESWIGARPSLTSRESALELETERWAFLREGEELCDARRTLEEAARLCREAAARSGSPDSLIRALIRVEDAIERSLGNLLARMGETGAWKGLRFSGVGHYAEERLGISRSQAQSRARLALVLRDRPLLLEALEEGRLGWEAASLVARMVPGSMARPMTGEQPMTGEEPKASEGSMAAAGSKTAAGLGAAEAWRAADGSRSAEGSKAAEELIVGGGDIESAWIDHAAETTIKRLRDELRLVDRDRAIRGGEVAITPIDDARWQASLARRPGQSRERIAQLGMQACSLPASHTVIRFRLPVDLASQLHSIVRSECHRLEKLCREMRGTGTREDSSPTEMVSTGIQGRAVAGRTPIEEAPGGHRNELVPGHAPASLLAAQMFSTRTGYVPEWCALLSLIEDFIATWDDPRQSPRRPGDKIYIRDGWRCSAPGCTSRRNLEEHHVVYRSRGGSDEPSNRVTACRFHHQRGEHGGLLRCRGQAPLGVTWWMGRQGVGGLFRNERRLE